MSDRTIAKFDEYSQDVLAQKECRHDRRNRCDRCDILGYATKAVVRPPEPNEDEVVTIRDPIAQGI